MRGGCGVRRGGCWGGRDGALDQIELEGSSEGGSKGPGGVSDGLGTCNVFHGERVG